MTSTIAAPSTIAAAVSDVPLDLLSKTSRELAGEIALRARLEIARALLIGARDALNAAQARVGTTVEVREDDTPDGAIIGHRFLGAKSAGVSDAQARVEQAEREIHELEAGVWAVDDAVVELARAIAEEHEALPSAKLRAELSRIDADRGRRREDLAEFEALCAAAKRELADLDDRSARGGETLTKDIAKLEAFVEQREREVRARAVALQRTLEESEPELVTLRSALDVAEEREAAEKAAIEEAELSRKITAAVRRQLAAVRELYAAEAALTALRSDLPGVSFTRDMGRSRDIFMNWVRGFLGDADA